MAAEKVWINVGPVDGPLFAEQRLKLLLVINELGEGGPERAADQELLEGLMQFLDDIADELHDRHRVDCLMNSGEEVIDG